MNNTQQMTPTMKQFNPNPLVAMLSQRYNLPPNIAPDPEAILNHLLNSGQITQGQIDQAVQMRKMFGK